MSNATLEFAQIMAAHKRVGPYIRHTPLHYSHALSARTGGEVWLKLECWQPTGSFKVRGALNVVGLLDPQERTRGVVTGSAGNHGLGVAHAARCWLDARGEPTGADVFVPATAPRAKVEKLRALGAAVHEVGTSYEHAHQAAERFAERTGAVYVSAYDDLDVIAGQGTVALEVLRDLPEVDMLIVPVGGGGLIAGIAAAMAAARPGCRVVGVQPAASPAALLSLRDGVAYDPYDHAPTIADGLAGGFGAKPFAVAHRLIEQILLATEQDLARSVFALLDAHQLVAEPSGAIAIAPLLSGELDASGKRLVCVITGGNIDTHLLRDILDKYCDGQ